VFLESVSLFRIGHVSRQPSVTRAPILGYGTPCAVIIDFNINDRPASSAEAVSCLFGLSPGHDAVL
jgi:hypothetical protein